MRGKNFSGFINRKSLSPELKFIVSTRATCRHKKKKKKKRDFIEDPKEEIWRKSKFAG